MELFDIQIERSLLFALADLSLCDPKQSLALIQSNGISRGYLYEPAHEEVLETMTGLLSAGKTASAGVMWGVLKGNAIVEKMGGRIWFYMMMSQNPDAWSHAIPAYWTTITGLAQRRRLLGIANEMARAAADAAVEVPDIVAKASASVSSVFKGSGAIRTAADFLMDEVLEELKERHSSQKMRLLPTGLPSLDEVIGGLQKELIIVGSLPSVGKSAFMLTVATNVAKSGHKVGIFSLEDSGDWIAWREIAREAPIDQSILRTKLLTDGQMDRVGEGCNVVCRHAKNIYVEDACAMTASQISVRADEMVSRYGCEVIIVDHIGEVRHDRASGDRYDLQIADSLATLRLISKRHRIPVVVVWHLKRTDGGDEGTPPKVTDFANSAASERMSRVALGLSRAHGSDTMRVDILKQTNGRKNVYVEVEFKGDSGTVADDGRSRARWSHDNTYVDGKP